MRGMKRHTPSRKPTRNCNRAACQRFDEVGLRVEVNHPETGELVAVSLRFCTAHAPEVWDMRYIRETIVDSLAA